MEQSVNQKKRNFFYQPQAPNILDQALIVLYVDIDVLVNKMDSIHTIS